jgi:hypothetical protein
MVVHVKIVVIHARHVRVWLLNALLAKLPFTYLQILALVVTPAALNAVNRRKIVRFVKLAIRTAHNFLVFVRRLYVTMDFI